MGTNDSWVAAILVLLALALVISLILDVGISNIQSAIPITKRHKEKQSTRTESSGGGESTRPEGRKEREEGASIVPIQLQAAFTSQKGFERMSRSQYNAVKRKEDAQRKQQEQLEFDEKQHSLNRQMVAIENGKVEIKEKSVELEVKKIKTLQDAFDVYKENAKLELGKSILEFSKDKFELEKRVAIEELERRAFTVKLDLQIQKFAVDNLMMQLVHYFHEQFNTLDRQKIQFLMEQQRFDKDKMELDLRKIEHQVELQKDSVLFQLQKLQLETAELDLKNQKLDLRDESADLREWESDLHVKGNQQRLRQDNFKFWEDRVLKHYGFTDFQSYFANWQQMNDLAKQYDYPSVDSFVSSMLPGRKYDRLISSCQTLQQKYQGLLSEVSTAK